MLDHHHYHIVLNLITDAKSAQSALDICAADALNPCLTIIFINSSFCYCYLLLLSFLSSKQHHEVQVINVHLVYWICVLPLSTLVFVFVIYHSYHSYLPNNTMKFTWYMCSAGGNDAFQPCVTMRKWIPSVLYSSDHHHNHWLHNCFIVIMILRH